MQLLTTFHIATALVITEEDSIVNVDSGTVSHNNLFLVLVLTNERFFFSWWELSSFTSWICFDSDFD